LLKSVLQRVLVLALCGRLSERECLLECRNIQVEGRESVPMQGVRVCSQEVLHRRKGLAQLMEQLTQVRACLSLGGVGPEQKGEMLARLGTSRCNTR